MTVKTYCTTHANTKQTFYFEDIVSTYRESLDLFVNTISISAGDKLDRKKV